MEHQPQTSHRISIARAFKPTETSLRSLRNTILLRLLLVSLIPLTILSIYFHYQFKSTLEQRTRLQLQTLASGHRQAIDRFINSKIHALKGIVDSSLISLPPDRPEVQKLHHIMKSLDNTILDVGVFDHQGRHIAYSGPFEFLEGKNYSREVWFRTLQDTDADYFVSDVYLGYRDQPHFIIAVEKRVDDKSWILRLSVNLSKFQQFVDDVNQVDAAHAFIINNKNQYQSVPDELGRPLDEAFVLPEGQGANAGQMELDVGEESYLVAAERLKTVDWQLVVIQPTSAAYAPIHQTQIIVFLIIALGIILTITASLLATTTLMREYAHSEENRAELVSQLVQAGKMGTMGEMAAGVAHEINNPLAIILSEIGVMEDLLDPSLGGRFHAEDFLRRLNSIREESNRCRSIIHKLLGFARRNKPNMSDCDLVTLVEQTVDMVERELTLENIEIRIELDHTLAPVHTDCDQLKQVLLNLIRNGADAIGKNGRITIHGDHSGEYLSLTVSDTGCGISQENIEQIFMPFFTTKDVGKGTGLGLSITHGIITALGGRIRVSSEPGQGTSFEIMIPRKYR